MEGEKPFIAEEFEASVDQLIDEIDRYLQLPITGDQTARDQKKNVLATRAQRILEIGFNNIANMPPEMKKRLIGKFKEISDLVQADRLRGTQNN